MNDLDRKIQEALRKEDAEALGAFTQEPSMFELMMETFRGRHRKLVWLTTFWAVAFFVLAVVSGVKFFNTQDTREMLMWAVAFMSCMSAVSLLKMWWFMEMNKNAITREIKRLELQVVRLAGRIKD